MERAEVKIDSWEPTDNPEFKYPEKGGKEEKTIEEELTPKLIKALRDGLGDSIP